MSGDYSRLSFDPRRHFAAVLAQQGRVLTDADWNEWAAVALHRVQAEALDTLGPAVAPREMPASFRIEAAGGALTIGPGRIYVDGLLAENHGAPPVAWDPRLAELRGTGATPYAGQPYLPDPPALPAGPGPHVAYLKVWQREVTSVEAPGLAEVALGGVDTSTRLQTVWQVKVLADVGQAVTCATPLGEVPGFAAAEPAAAGRLSTDTADVPGQPDPCQVPPSGGYKGLENQLYRVEIHSPGDLSGADAATFKWSRDNGTVRSRVTHVPALDRIVVESVGRDDVLRFSDGDWVEVTDDRRELAGLPGEMRRIRAGGGVDDATRTILLDTPLPAGAFPVDAQFRTAAERNTRVRRWDQRGKVLAEDGTQLDDLDDPGSDGTIAVRAGTRIVLENGVVVAFGLNPAAGTFRTGDHWVFAARTADASVEILTEAPPRGVHAHYAKLAVVSFPDSETDCRTLWPPETGDRGCDCTVCVSPESHASGALTIQAAVDQVKEAGGTVCLGPGLYPLREPLRIDRARSVRVRGQGWATTLMAAGGDGAVRISSSTGVVMERLTLMASAAREPVDTVTITNTAGVALEECVVVNLGEDGQAAAVRLEGYLLGAVVRDCVVAGRVGLGGGARDDGYLATAELRFEDNWVWAPERGVSLERFCLHLGRTRIAGNTVYGGRDAGVVALGGNAPGGGFDVVGNLCRVTGSGIVAGVDAVRIRDNDLRGGGQAERRVPGTGIALERGLDPGGIGGCHVVGNRVDAFPGNGVAIRTRVRSGMIKQNSITGTGTGGIVVEDDGRADELVVDNNQLLEIAQGASPGTPQPAAMRFLNVRDLDVGANAVHGVAQGSVVSEERVAIRVLGGANVRIRDNRITGLGPAQEFVGGATAIEVWTPLSAVTVTGNAVDRARADATGDLGPGRWAGLAVRGPAFADTTKLQRLPLGDVMAAFLPTKSFLLTRTSVSALAVTRLPEATVGGNSIRARQSAERPLLVESVASCVMSGNRVATDAPPPSLVRCRAAVVSGNELRGRNDTDVLHVTVGSPPAVVGNLRTGRIMVNNQPLGPPWDSLNPPVPA